MIKYYKTFIYQYKSEFTVIFMLYTRNKDCFKKTTAKIEHNQARKNILNLVK